MSQRGPASHRMPRTAKPISARLRIARRALFALVSSTALVATGMLWWGAHDILGGFTVSAALPSDAARSSGGAMNILLIGLDSRKDQDGNALPQDILDQLHAGDSDQGGYNTNTLILMHVSPDDKVTAFSIPRDDYFTGILDTNVMPTQAGGPAGSDRDTASTVKAVLRCRVAARWRRASGGGARDTRHGTCAPEKAARLRPPRVPVTGQWQATT